MICLGFQNKRELWRSLSLNAYIFHLLQLRQKPEESGISVLPPFQFILCLNKEKHLPFGSLFPCFYSILLPQTPSNLMHLMYSFELATLDHSICHCISQICITYQQGKSEQKPEVTLKYKSSVLLIAMLLFELMDNKVPQIAKYYKIMLLLLVTLQNTIVRHYC